MGSSKKQTTGYQYFFAIHMGLCRGPVNAITQIRVGDLVAWTGRVFENVEINIQAAALFGGDEKEGGVAGPLQVLMGYPEQLVPSGMKNLMGGSVPEFRGVTTMFFNGQIASNNPYPKAWEFRADRTTAGWFGGIPWYPAKAEILLANDAGEIHAMNGAHIIYECITNPEWGRALPVSMLDEASFISAANTLCSEMFGLCMKWDRQSDLDEFLQSVIQHIGGALYVSRQTGLINLRLLRDDYNANDLPTFDANSGLLSIDEDEQAGTQTEFNEIIYKWFDPIEKRERQGRVQNLASQQALGSVLSHTVDYPGLPIAELGARVGTRDLRMNTGLKRFKVVLDRRGWKIDPAGVFRVSAPEKGINNVVLRAAKVVDSMMADGRITVSALEDMFGLPASSYTLDEPSGWVPPIRNPLAPSVQEAREGTYRDLVRELDPSSVESLTETQGVIATLARTPNALSPYYDIQTAAPGETLDTRGSENFAPGGDLANTLGLYTTDLELDLFTLQGANEIIAGALLLVEDEFLKVVIFDPTTGVGTIERGCVDTIPQQHAPGVPVWLYDDYAGSDDREYNETEEVEIKLLTRTSSGQLSPDVAVSMFVTIAARQAKPYPPGDVRMNTTLAGEVDDPVIGDMVFTWAHRDRISQSDQIVSHLEADIGPEAGVTYNVRVIDIDTDTTLRDVTGLSVTTWTYDVAMAETDGWVQNIRFELESERDGIVSWQAYGFVFDHRETEPEGFGYDFGNNFGGGA